MSYDVRVIANFVLQIAASSRIKVSNLSLNKIVYFLHVGYLHEYGSPLVTAKIEAWDHGPVFRELYHQFKEFGRDNITKMAKKLDISTGKYADIEIHIAAHDKAFLTVNCNSFLRISAGKLVDMSHLEDGAWHRARYGNGRVNPGAEITDDLIMQAGIGRSKH